MTDSLETKFEDVFLTACRIHLKNEIRKHVLESALPKAIDESVKEIKLSVISLSEFEVVLSLSWSKPK